MKIILASQSEIRKRALDMLHLPYDVHPSHFDEKSIRDNDPFKMALRLSEAKARAVAAVREGIIIGSDAFMVMKGKIIEKPVSLENAFEMLKSFSEETFQFITGLVVLNTADQKMLSAVESCEIKFRELSAREVEDYISQRPVLKFAGAVEADGIIRFSEWIRGNCNFFTGLPMNRLIEFLREHGVKAV